MGALIIQNILRKSSRLIQRDNVQNTFLGKRGEPIIRVSLWKWYSVEFILTSVLKKKRERECKSHWRVEELRHHHCWSLHLFHCQQEDLKTGRLPEAAKQVKGRTRTGIPVSSFPDQESSVQTTELTCWRVRLFPGCRPAADTQRYQGAEAALCCLEP